MKLQRVFNTTAKSAKKWTRVQGTDKIMLSRNGHIVIWADNVEDFDNQELTKLDGTAPTFKKYSKHFSETVDKPTLEALYKSLNTLNNKDSVFVEFKEGQFNLSPESDTTIDKKNKNIKLFSVETLKTSISMMKKVMLDNKSISEFNMLWTTNPTRELMFTTPDLEIGIGPMRFI